MVKTKNGIPLSWVSKGDIVQCVRFNTLFLVADQKVTDGCLTLVDFLKGETVEMPIEKLDQYNIIGNINKVLTTVANGEGWYGE